MNPPPHVAQPCMWFISSWVRFKVLQFELSTPFLIVPTPRVRITQTPSTVIYTTTRLNLTCITVLNPDVDTPMIVTHTWRGPSGNISPYSSRPIVYNVTQVGQVYWSSIFFSSGILSSDSGTTYSCTSNTNSTSSSSHIVASGPVVASTRITVGKKRVITG